MPRSITQKIVQIRQRALNPNDLIEASYEKLNRLRHLNAFTFVKSQNELRAQASEINQRSNAAALPLRGMPIVIKDNFCVRGMPATCGSRMLQNFHPPYTATVVQKLIDAGAIIIGKSNMDEFGMGCGTLDSIAGPTKNVWGLDGFRSTNDNLYTDWKIPGGSSGGSAVAVASGIADAALGSDTGGSTRNPASYCGVVGLKPTYGLLSRYGLIPLVNSLDVPGILTRNIEDCALILNIIKGFDENDSTSHEGDLPHIDIASEPSIKGLRIGIPDDFIGPGMDPEVIQCWTDIANLLEKNGAQVSKVSMPHTKYSIACYSVLNPCEVASNMARYDGLRFGHRSMKPPVNSTESLYAQTRHEGFNDVVRGRILAGNYFLLKANYDKYFMQAMKIRRLITNDFEAAWKDRYELLLTPVTLSAAPTYSEFIQKDSRTQTAVQDYCTQSANMAGVPALSLPIKLNAEGLPLSLQLIGPKFSENKLLNVGKFIENKVGFADWSQQH